MFNNISNKEFKRKLNENNHYTGIKINDDDYYKHLDKLYNAYFKTVTDSSYHLALQSKHS